VPWVRELREELDGANTQDAEFAAIYFTNHPLHYGDEESLPPSSGWFLFVASQPTVPIEHLEAINALPASLWRYAFIPSLFDEAEDAASRTLPPEPKIPPVERRHKQSGDANN
jgi:hypothetical protein